MLGAVIGDIVGSIYEFKNHRSKDFPLFGAGVTFTDDSVCTVALAHALVSGDDPAKTLQSWCRRYPARGYGGKFKNWIREPVPKPYNSLGNGAAMRVSSAAWLGLDMGQSLSLADKITAITHNHPEGMRGARATCRSIRMAIDGALVGEIRDAVNSIYEYDLSRTVDEIRPVNRFDETCQGTVPVALICALTANDFEDAIRNAISVGGDSDTIAAIAGSIAEPLFGIPKEIAAMTFDYLPEEFCDVIVKVRIAHQSLRRN
ncbi:MAG: ADP-ribosylglycohydrolase family protein [Azonexus sp.]|nr:ADP-ribosylglycohydrolase family protein [Azonexus sp.]